MLYYIKIKIYILVTYISSRRNMKFFIRNRGKNGLLCPLNALQVLEALYIIN
jgi:hypothetical protein